MTSSTSILSDGGTRAIALAAAVVAGMAGAAGADDVTLRYIYGPEPITYRMIMTMDSEISGGMFGATPMKSVMKQAILGEFKSKSSTPEASQVELSYTALKTLQSGPTGPAMFMDTTSEEFKAAKREDLDPMARGSSSMLNKPMTLTITPRGKITKVEKSEAFDDVLKEMKNLGPAGSAMAEQMFGEEGVKKIFSETFVVLPEGPVKPGQTWTNSVTKAVPMFGSLKSTTTWTFVGVEVVDGKSLARLTSALEAEVLVADPKAKSAMAKIPGMDMDVSSTGGKGTGVALFDVKAGRLQSMSFHLDMPMTMNMKTPAAGQQPAQTMTMTMKSATTGMITLVPPGAPIDPENVVKPEGKSDTKPAGDKSNQAAADAPSKNH